MGPIERPPNWVGREGELAILRAGVDAVRRGEGAVVWVEGEAGIGKSSLVAEALATADPGWEIGWGIADRLTERLPLRVMLDCLGVRPGSPDPRRAKAAELLRSERLGLISAGDASAIGVEVLVALVDELCAAAPAVIVIDDVQWADAASLIVWHQLAASITQLRLLLIATCRPSPPRGEVREVRGAVARRGDQMIRLGPLPEADVAALVTKMLGSPSSDDALGKLTAQAAGNPLYVRELVDALVRERAPQITAEGSVASERLPVSLASVLSDRLASVPAETERMLQTAALLGGKFTVTDLAVLLHRPALELAASLQEAVTTGILAASGPELAFRHPLIRQFLYESMPAALRTALHAEAARELAATGADPLSVAQQLFAARQPGAGWARTWLVETAPVLVTRAPQLAADLLQRELAETPGGGDETGDGLMASLARALLAAGSHEQAERQASQALTVMTDPVLRAETYFVLAHAQVSVGRDADAAGTVRQALASAGLPDPWQPRMLALLAKLERASTGDLDGADVTARRALAVAREAADAFATGHALVDLWLSSSVRRDHAGALDYLDQALVVLGDDPAHAGLRSFALDSRIFTLQNLDRWPEAELAVRTAREDARRSGSPGGATWANAAVLRYWLGQWDDALAELGSDEPDVLGPGHSYLREHWSALLVHGVAALIAGRRDQRGIAGQQLRKGLALPILTIPERENQDFLIAAHAVALEQAGETGQAMRVLAGILPRRHGEMTLVHQWLPDLVRLALAADDERTARTAAHACAAEAAAETRPARAAATSLRCQGLLTADPAPLHEAVAHYRTAGPAAELPAALEDLAAVLAHRSRDDEARLTLNEAAALYETLDAHWDIRRAGNRLRPYGIRRGTRGRRRARAATGWESLTPTEIKIAYLIGEGRSNPDVAARLYMSRNTVQTHVSHILAKLGARSRTEIMREVLRQGIAI